ncbi:MAG TPA: pyridoxal-dependent decarboxylase [Blastocatellia bacterium]|nr:pyridoxal-dependent decarboxylase [Blastocatellia bacterium]
MPDSKRPATASVGPASLTGDMDPEEFRKFGHQVVDWITTYLAHPERYPVLSQVKPGDIRNGLPQSAPAVGEDMASILADLDRFVTPGLTHWNHPAFFAYFAVSGSAPGILGEMLSAAFNVNAMMWRTSPAATELEEVTLNWMRQLIGLPDSFDGVIYDTASISSLCAIAAAREAVTELNSREDGMSANPASGIQAVRLRLYASEQAHSSIDKAAITLGLGQAGLRKISTDDQFRMDPAALARAIREDRAAGWRPFCVVATTGTTSTTSIDPVPEIASISESEGLWLHVDGAYGGSAAVAPEFRWVLDGADRADSVVVNPHKWLFVPVDLSTLFCRRMDVLKRAFSLVPEYLRAAGADQVHNYMDYGPQLGRRFRALKLWFVLRYFGAEGLAARIREHIALARGFADWVDQSPNFERMAPAPLSTVCFRAFPEDLRSAIAAPRPTFAVSTPSETNEVAGPSQDGSGLTVLQVESYLDQLNERLLEEINRAGRVFLSHTKLSGKLTLRLAIGNIRTTGEHILLAREELQLALAKLDPALRSTHLSHFNNE